jgi:Sec-independent protein translocase protein TatA
MFGWGELGLIAILAIILLGPERLPEIFRTLGKLYAEYKKAQKRFELEVLYGYKLPDKDLLDMLSQKRIDEIIKSELQPKKIEIDENIKKLLMDEEDENDEKQKGKDLNKEDLNKEGETLK